MSLYVITDGKNNYIRRDFKGRYTPVKSRALADEFDELRIAEKVLKNNISSKQRGKYYILFEKTCVYLIYLMSFLYEGCHQA